MLPLNDTSFSTRSSDCAHYKDFIFWWGVRRAQKAAGHTNWCDRLCIYSICMSMYLCVSFISILHVYVFDVTCVFSESVSQSSQLLLFLFMSFANICCSCVLDTFRTECLLRGLPGVGRVPAWRRRKEALAAVMWAGLLSAERLLWMKLPPPWGYCSVSRVEEENT